MSTVLMYVITFLLVFGAKISSFFDLSLITSCMLSIFLLISGKAKLTKPFSTLLIILITFFLYITLISVFLLKIDIVFYGRVVRCSIGIISISTYYSSSPFSPSKKLQILTNVLLLHALFVIFSSLAPQFQEIVKPITGFGLPATRFRSTGFTNGYDFSGAICLIGLIIETNKTHKTKRDFLKIAFFSVASIFTSRVTMILFLFIMILFIFFSKDVKKWIKISLLVIIAFVSIPIVGIVLYSFGYDNNIITNALMGNPTFASIFDKLIYYYASGGINDSLSEHYDFSGINTHSIVFGSLLDSGKDPGYVQYIYSVGIIGLSIAVLFYLYILIYCLKSVKRCKKNICNAKFLSKSISLIVVLVFFISAKNSYMLARHITEIIIILLSINVSSLRRNYRKGITVNGRQISFYHRSCLQC